MAIAPDSLDTASSSEDSNLRHNRSSVRHRLSNRVAAKALPESDSNSPWDESPGNDINDTDLIGNLCEIAVESADEMPTTESGSEGPSFGNENEDTVKGNAETSNAKEVEFHYRASAPAHRKIKESPLSSDAIFKQSHAGLFNLCVVVLVAVNSRLIIENLMKYGWLINSGFWFSSKSLGDWPLLMCCSSLPIFPLAAFLVEKLVQQKYISEFVVILAHIVITTVEIVYPVLVILRFDSAVLSGVTLMFFSCIVWLKLVSYAHTNYDLRVLEKSKGKREALSNYWSSSGGSMLGGIGSTIAQGMAFGTGSAVAHRAVDAVVGPRTIHHETMVFEVAAVPGPSSMGGSDACMVHSKD